MSAVWWCPSVRSRIPLARLAHCPLPRYIHASRFTMAWVMATRARNAAPRRETGVNVWQKWLLDPERKNRWTRRAPSSAESQVDVRCRTHTMDDHGMFTRFRNSVSVVDVDVDAASNMGGLSVNECGYSPSMYLSRRRTDLSNSHGTCMERRMTSSRWSLEVNWDTVMCFTWRRSKYDMCRLHVA